MVAGVPIVLGVEGVATDASGQLAISDSTSASVHGGPGGAAGAPPSGLAGGAPRPRRAL